MKTIKLSLVAIALLFGSVTTNAVEKTKGVKMTEDAVVSTYINAISTGNTKVLDKILDADMQFNLQRGTNISTVNKETLLDEMSKTNTIAPVKTSTSVMQSDDSSEKVKITFNYDGYTRTDIITLYHALGWSITSVTSSTL